MEEKNLDLGLELPAKKERKPRTRKVKLEERSDSLLASAAPRKKTKKYRIMINEQDGELNYLPVGVNGKVYQIMRGVEVVVPEEVVDVLRNAITDKVIREPQQDGTIKREVRKVPYISYQVLGVVEE
jgi:hypothetical protein